MQDSDKDVCWRTLVECVHVLWWYVQWDRYWPVHSMSRRMTMFLWSYRGNTGHLSYGCIVNFRFANSPLDEAAEEYTGINITTGVICKLYRQYVDQCLHYINIAIGNTCPINIVCIFSYLPISDCHFEFVTNMFRDNTTVVGESLCNQIPFEQLGETLPSQRT